jgi:hypothetical protein
MPVLYDYCLHVSISFLNRYGYLNPNQWKNGIITWSSGEGEDKAITARIGISVHIGAESYLELNYKQHGKPICYRVQLVSVPSNIGKGVIWFFVCPQTGRRCRKLYCVGGKFLHREAFMGCLYEVQTYSKVRRRQHKIFESMFSGEHILNEIDKPFFKTMYGGKPTKRFQKMIKLAKEIKKISLSELF